MNNNKQSSVEWLQAIELERDLTLADWNKAKAMHEEEMKNFTEDWYFYGPLLGEGIDVKNTIEQHFNNTYGGGDK